MNNENELNFNLLCGMCKDLPGFDHTELRELDELNTDDNFTVAAYTECAAPAVHGPIISTQRDDYGELKIYSVNDMSHVLVIGNTGSGKTQGYILSQLANLDGKTSVVVIDIKGELVRNTRSHAERVYGKKNVHVFNTLDPTTTDVFINPLKAIAQEYMDACLIDNKAKQKSLLAQAEAKLRTMIARLFPTTDLKIDRSWQDIARQLLLGIAIGLMEDQNIAPSGKRKKLSPKDITIAKMREIYESFEIGGYQGGDFNDKGFFSSRKKTSNACKYSRVALNNANTTRLNYLGFAADMLNHYADPKITTLTSDNNFDFNTLAQTPQILYILVDFSDVVVREFVNLIITLGIDTLLKTDYARGNSRYSVPVNFIIDEFSTMMPDAVYPNMLATGRGSKIFLTMVVQSLSQLEARYSTEWQTMTENCNLQVFVGTNDNSTAKYFCEELGKTTLPDPIAYLNGGFSAAVVPVVTQDYLCHRMRPGEVFIKVHGGHPIHGHYEYFYKTGEYTVRSDEDEIKTGDCADETNDNENSLGGVYKLEVYLDDEKYEDITLDNELWDEEPSFDGDEYDCEIEDDEDCEIDCDEDDGQTEKFEEKCMDEIEKLVLLSEDNDREDVIEIAEQRLKRARSPERIKILERVVHELQIATDSEFNMLKKQLFG